MLKWFGGVKFSKLVVIVPLVSSILIPLYPTLTKQTRAAAFSIKTGYYIGNATARSITGLGFQPEFIILKQNISTAAAGLIKTKDMAGSTVASTGTAANTTGVTIDSDGFTLTNSTSVNVSGDYVTYVAMAGSDCSASGSMCVGTYAGDGTGAKAISTGFQPSLVVAKSNLAVGAHFKTASMPAANTEFFTSTAANTASAYVGALSVSGFSAGTQNNLNGSTYYYAAFKADSSKMSEGTYTGNGTDNRDLSVTSYTPSMVLTKNSSSASSGNRRSVWSTTQSYGDLSGFISDTPAAAANLIQALQPTGFQLGGGAFANENGATIYWFSFGGASNGGGASGSFKMDVGTYSGTGSTQSISGLLFKPDLVLIKADSASAGVFRTSMMPGDLTFFSGSAGADFSGGITSIDSSGFSLGTNAAVNAAGTTYYWQAFGNGYNPNTNSGALDFAVGAVTGNSTDNRNITGLPFQPDLVMARKTVAGTTIFRTSSHSGDSASVLSSTSDGANMLQGFSTEGFQLGNPSTLNVVGNVTYWISFKQGPNLSVGTYTGDSVADRAITSPAFQPDLVWIKHTSTQIPVQRSSSLSGDLSQYFTPTANASGKIKSLTASGFTLGTTGVNDLGNNYRYIAWKIPNSGTLGVSVVNSGGSEVTTPSFDLSSLGFLFDCSSASGLIGQDAQRIRITNTTPSPAWSLSVAPSAGATALWGNSGNTQNYDFNDPTTSGCTDGGDADSKAGRMTIDASAGTLSAEVGCTNTNTSLGTSAAFSEGVTDSITLISASVSAETGCYWDLTGIGIEQIVPALQPSDSYNLDLTITATAS